MYSETECPYCGREQEIYHDDGYGCEENEMYTQGCVACEKTFAFTTAIHFTHKPYQAECLNGGEHDFKPTNTSPLIATIMRCEMCGEERDPTDREMLQIYIDKLVKLDK